MSEVQKSLNAKVEKVDESLGVIFGYAIICKELNDDGEFVQYTDKQDDQIEESEMTACALEFMEKSRVAKLQHDGDSIGMVVFGFPATEDIVASLGISVTKTGLIIGVKPDDEAILKKFANGELTGFSIGGVAGETEETDAA